MSYLYKGDGTAFEVSGGGSYPLEQKWVCCFGDSFSAGGEWLNKCCEILEAFPYNKSISGGGWCTGRTKTVYELAQEATQDPDVIVIPIGTNDIANNVEIGSFVNGTSVDDYNEATFYGGMQKALTYIRNRWSGVPVFIGTTPASGLTTGNIDTYINAMKEICIRYGCEYIETRGMMMAYPLIQNDLQYRNSATDGHPSTMGKAQIGKRMADIIGNCIVKR